MNYYLLTLQYDGSDFSGWVVQKNAKTVQGELNTAIQNIIKTKEFKTLGASKTDAGVHARDQKVLFTCNFKIDNHFKFIRALNKALPKSINLIDLQVIDSNFNIRDVQQKIYSYTINTGEFDVFNSRYELNWDYKKINVKELQMIFNLFVGVHDFKLFSGLNTIEQKEMNTIRKIDSIKLNQKGKRIIITLKAAGFIRYQIRMIIAAALNVYQERLITLDDIQNKLNGIGEKSNNVIDPNGLCLEKIIFN